MTFEHCVKSVRIRSYSDPRFSRIRTECGKMRTRMTPNTDTFHAVKIYENLKPTALELS